MKRIAIIAALLGSCAVAYAADMPIKAPLPLPVTGLSGFYIGANVGASGSGQQTQFITAPGTATAAGGLPGKLYPSGVPVGGTVGFGGSLGGLYAAVEAEFDYDFNSTSGQCSWAIPGAGAIGVNTTCGSKNGMLMTQGVVLGIPFSSLTGALASRKIAALTPPSQWPIPVTVPTSISASNIMPFVKGGIAERNVSAFVDPVTVGATRFAGGDGKETLIGYLVGGGLKVPLAAGWTATAEYNYIGYNKQFIPASTVSTGIFTQSTFKQTNDQSLKFKMDYGF